MKVFYSLCIAFFLISCSVKNYPATTSTQANLISFDRKAHTITLVTVAGDTIMRRHTPRGLPKFPYVIGSQWIVYDDGREVRKK